MAKRVYDCIILGGGPAGLSAAVYMGRFLRSTALIDSSEGRSTWAQTNENYLGFPRGIKVTRLRELGRRQAERFGAEFIAGTVATASREDDGFLLSGDCGDWRARTVIIATGVTDVWPAFSGVRGYVGRSLFWCITCDGFRSRGKRTVLIGATDEAAVTACQFQRYTSDLLFINESVSDLHGISPEKLDDLREQEIAVVDGRVERVEGSRGAVRRVIVGGETYEVDVIFSLLGAVPNSQLGAQLGVLLDDAGYIRIDTEQRTNVPCIYAAGDVTGPFAHQISTAVHEGATAAQTANYELYEDHQKD